MNSLSKYQGQWRRKRPASKPGIAKIDLKAVLDEAQARGVDPDEAMRRMMDAERTPADLRVSVCLAALRDSSRGG